MKKVLQQMYDSANWYGYTMKNGKKYTTYRISNIANRLGINLEYNCPC